MKNVLYIAPDLKVKGGISSVLKGYLETDLRSLHKLHFISSHRDGCKLRKALRLVAGILKCILYLAIKDIDIVHIHSGDIVSVKRKYLFFTLARLAGLRVICHLHGSSFFLQLAQQSRRWQTRLVRMLETADIVICLSRSWVSEVKMVAPLARTTVITNAIRLPAFATATGNDVVQLAFLGHIIPAKGIFDLLKVVRCLADDGLAAHLHVGGKGEVRRLHAEVRSLALQDRVTFHGWLSESARDELLRQTDVLVLPSYHEALPMSLLEAMSCGVAVVSTTVGGIPELVADQETGYLCSPGDLGALYGRLRTLIENPELRRRFGRQGRLRIEREHNLERTAAMLHEIYQSL